MPLCAIMPKCDIMKEIKFVTKCFVLGLGGYEPQTSVVYIEVFARFAPSALVPSIPCYFFRAVGCLVLIATRKQSRLSRRWLSQLQSPFYATPQLSSNNLCEI